MFGNFGNMLSTVAEETHQLVPLFEGSSIVNNSKLFESTKMLLLNLTLSRLAVSDLFGSPFISSRCSVNARNLLFRRSFHSAFFGHMNLNLRSSTMSHFLSSAIFLTNQDIYSTTTITSDTNYQNIVANRVSSRYSHGGGVLTTSTSPDSYTVSITQSTFQTCASTTPQGGGAIYIENAKSLSVSNTRAYFCSACDGAFLVALGSSEGEVTLSEILTSECGPGIRPGGKNAIHVDAPKVTILKVNVTNGEVMGDGAGIRIAALNSVSVTDFVAKSVGGDGAIDLDFPIPDPKLLGLSVIDSRLRGHGAVTFYGDYAIEYGCYLNNTGDTIYSKIGILTFRKCWFDRVYFESPYVRFEGCTIELNNPQKVPVYTGNEVVFSQTPWVNLVLSFADQVEDTLRTPFPTQTRGFGADAVGGLAIAGLCLGVIAMFVAICCFVPRFREFRNIEIANLHQYYADNGATNDENEKKIPIETIGEGEEKEQIDLNITLEPLWNTDDEFHAYGG